MAEVAVPTLVVARPITDAIAWRETRLGHSDVRIGLVTDGATRVPSAALREAGLEVAGLLGPDALESIAWGAEAEIPCAYADLPALLSDEIDAIAIDVPAPRSDVLISAAAKARLGVLLAAPRLGDPHYVAESALALDEDDLPHTVAFLGRADDAYAELESLDLGAISQVTAVGWPAGAPPRAELVDLVRRLCGEVLAVCADPLAMPAPTIGDDAVTLALLTDQGTTVLASERFAARQADCLLTLAAAGSRAVLTRGLLTVDGEPRGVERSTPAGALRLAGAALREPWDHPRAASLFDLASAGHVLAAVERSRTEGGWVELS